MAVYKKCQIFYGTEMLIHQTYGGYTKYNPPFVRSKFKFYVSKKWKHKVFTK